jgi:chromosome partitioning protein
MNKSALAHSQPSVPEFDELIIQQAQRLSDELQAHRLATFPPAAEKPLRTFSAAEAAKFLGTKGSYLRNLSLEGKGPLPQLTPTNRRNYTAEQIQDLRTWLAAHGAAGRRYVPHRRDNEHLQVIVVANFKGGSAKTTTTAHLGQHLALHGYRVLVIDMDPQASLSALHGFQPELDLAANQSLYGTIRYDNPRPLTDIIRKTNFPGLHIIPAQIELTEFEYDTPKILTDGNPGQVFFSRLTGALQTVAGEYDVVVIDCPPQLGYLTMLALCAATAVLITVNPQMLDVLSMSQFLLMLGAGVMAPLRKAGAVLNIDWMRYLVTRFEPTDGPQIQMVQLLRALFGDYVLSQPMLKSVAISDAGITKQTLYEVERRQFTPSTYDRAMESLDAVNGEIETLINAAWGR